jgi:glutathionylspermidine synthase
VVGIVDPTEIPEDLGHLRLIERALAAAGARTVRGAPFNLHAAGNHVGLFGMPIDVLLRHYKTDWWAERASPWRDEPPPPDAAPLSRELALIAAAMQAGTLAVANPFGAAIAQNKRLLALPWERPELFAADLRAEALVHLPETRFLESVPRAQLIAERAAWVLKSDYGCEGEEVVLGRDVDAAHWAQCLDLAVPGRWAVQRAFTPRREADGCSANHGVFLVGGRPSGIYTRRSATATGRDARSVPTLVRP